MFLNNFICSTNAGLVVFYILDVIIIVAILITLYFMFFRKPQNANQDSPDNEVRDNAEKVKVSQINTDGQNSTLNQSTEIKPTDEEKVVQADKTEEIVISADLNNNQPEMAAEESYIVPSNDFSKKKTKQVKPKPYINKVEHFSTQIANLSEEASTELKSKVNAKPRKSAQPIKRIVKDETIILNDKSDNPIKVTSYEGATSFLDTIKEQQSMSPSTSKPKKTETKPAETKKQTKTASKTKSQASKSKPTETAKRKYTKKNKDEVK